MKHIILLLVSSVALAAFAAGPADITGTWTATVTTAAGSKDFQYVFRQNGGELIGTIRSQEGVAAISDGYINYKTVTFFETVTAGEDRSVIAYTGELVSDNEIKFKRQAAGRSVEFVATRKPGR